MEVLFLGNDLELVSIVMDDVPAYVDHCHWEVQYHLGDLRYDCNDDWYARYDWDDLFCAVTTHPCTECWWRGEEIQRRPWSDVSCCNDCDQDWWVGDELELWYAGYTRKEAPHVLSTCKMRRRDAQRHSALPLSSAALERNLASSSSFRKSRNHKKRQGRHNRIQHAI